MTVLITGASGFVGRHYLRTLNPFSEQHVAVDLRIPPTNLNDNRPIAWLPCDLCNKNEVTDLIDRVEPSAIIHLAAISMTGKDEALKFNISMVNNLLHAITKWTARPKIILAGSAAEYGEIGPNDEPPDEWGTLNPLEPYAESKVIISRVAHAYRRNFNLPITILRFANIYGPWQETGKLVPNLVKATCDGDTITLNAGGKPTRQWIYIDDVVRAIDCALKRDVNGVFNIGSVIEVSLHRLTEMIITATQLIFDFHEKLFTPPKIVLRDGNGGAMRIAMDINLAERQLDFTPVVGLSTGLRRTIESYLAETDAIRTPFDSRRDLADAEDLL